MSFNPETLEISIVEDDQDIRENLALIISSIPQFTCIHTYESGEEILRTLKNDFPDIILMDISLPGMSGIECVAKLRERTSETEILMLTVHQDDKLVFDSLCAGASGYLIKNISPEKLIDSINEVVAGGAPMSTQIARLVIKSFQKKPPKISLTKREQDVLQELCLGKSYKMIAKNLFVSRDTVRTHIKHIYQKLEVNSKSEAVAKAIKHNIV